MANNDITNYIRETRGSGFSDDQIRDSLITAGWAQSDVNEAFSAISTSPTSASTPMEMGNTGSAPLTSPTSTQGAGTPVSTPKIDLGEPIQSADKDSYQSGITQKIQNTQIPEGSLGTPKTTSPQVSSTLRNLLEEEKIGPNAGNQDNLLESTDAGNLETTKVKSEPIIKGSNEPLPDLQGVRQTASPRRFLIPALVALGLVGVVGAGYFIFSSLSSNPAQTIETAFINWSQAQTYSYSGRLQFNLPTQTSQAIKEFNEAGSNKYRTQLAQLNNEILNDNLAQAQTTGTSGITVNFSGNTDFSDPNSVKKTLIIDVPEGPNLSLGFGFETTVAGGQFYLKPTRISAPSELDLNFILNQPILVDLTRFATILDQPALTGEAQKLTSSQRITSQDVSGLSEKYQVFTDLQSLPGETIGNQETNHYGFRGTDQFGTAMEEILSKGTLPLEIISAIKELTNVTGEIWIGQDDNMPVRIKLSGTNTAGRSDLELNFTNFNEPLNIAAPENPKLLGLAIFELFDEVAKSGIELPNIPATLFIDTDQDGLYDAIEEFYAADPSNRDTDGDSYIDGEEVRNSYSPAGPGRLEY